ncbi:MAG: DUF2807 domain-containing protein [Flavobacteriaceae bacterium]|nr:DUF2807 domain-containing protein [Flavobacteriaceae bacterium]
MKHLLYILVTFILIGCDSENGLNCFQTAGPIIQVEVEVTPFDRILVEERVQLIIEKGEEYQVIVETGENLFNDIEVRSENGLLTLINSNGCNLVRDYGLTKIHVKTPTLTEIRNSSGLTVESRGVLEFEELLLLSEDRDSEDEFHIDGDFILNLSVDHLEINANGLSKFYLSGTANSAVLGIYDGEVRIDAKNFLVQDVYLFHRSTQNLIINPQNSIKGKIVSIGDVIALTRPPVVQVEELFRGRLIFQ